MKILGMLIGVLLALLAQSFPAAAQEQPRVAKIEITGYERVDRGVIANTIKSKEGELYDLTKLRADLKDIFKTGYFSDVQIDVRDTDTGKLVTFVVVERPPIKAIFVAGNKEITTADIRDKLKIQTKSVLNIERVKESADEIRKLYASKGYYNAKVSYELEQEETYDVDVKFFIVEPPKATVKKIAFKGNKAFKDSSLKDFMKTKEEGILSWFTGSGILDEEALEDDRKNIEAFYADHGYVRARVGVPDIAISKDGKKITITLLIEEGSVYKIGSVDFVGDVLFPKDVLIQKLQTKTGKIFRGSVYQQDMLMLTDLYQDQGYAFCQVNPLTLIDDDALRVDINYEIVKGKIIYFNRINTIGNVRTRDKVIRRELRFAEGDRYSAAKLRESQRRLRNTNFFKTLDMKIGKTDEDDKINMDVTVEEKPTGTLSAGLGYSSSESLMVTGSVSQENLFGTGRKLFLEASIGSVTQHFKLSFLEPYFLDMDLGLGLNIFNYQRVMDTYDWKKRGGGFNLSRPLTDYVRLGFAYRYEVTRVYNISWDASRYVKEQFGTRTTSSTTYSISKNTIDNIQDPSRGINTQLSLELAGGPFGGDNNFVRFGGFYGRYFPWKALDSTFFLRATAGTIRNYGNLSLPIYEKYFVGGIDSIRGFKYGEAGPMDYTGEPVGSENQLFFNAEWVFPIWKPVGLKGVVFFDYGAGFDGGKGWLFDDLRPAAGLGIRWASPFGPIRIEFGFNLSPRQGERRSVFDFAMGTQY